jgi:succinate dehydrogenase hydrophobic anchor subunit
MELTRRHIVFMAITALVAAVIVGGLVYYLQERRVQHYKAEVQKHEKFLEDNLFKYQ